MNRNTTFRAGEDFDCYREKLTGISPATISMLMDLQIETKKDIAALLLKYTKWARLLWRMGRFMWTQELPGLRPVLIFLEMGITAVMLNNSEWLNR